MEATQDWSKHAEEWLARDLALLSDSSGFRSLVARPNLQVGSRPMPDDPNHLFRWRLPEVAAPAEVVFEGFVHRLLDYHKEWTREFVGGQVGYAPERHAELQGWAQRAWDTGQPALDFVGHGGGTFLAPPDATMHD